MLATETKQETGYFRLTKLPSGGLKSLWEYIVIPQETRNYLISYAATLADLERLDGAAPYVGRILMFYGLPGTGKSSTARGLADFLSRTQWANDPVVLAEIRAEQLFSRLLGETAKEIKKAFAELHFLLSQSRVVVVVDEVEWITFSRARLAQTDDTPEQMRAVYAVFDELDQLARNHNVLIIATTNMPELSDRGFLRRVDEAILFPLPGFTARRQILSKQARIYKTLGVRLAEADIESVCQSSKGLSGADMVKLIWLARTLTGQAWDSLSRESMIVAVDHLRSKQHLTSGISKGKETHDAES